MNSELEIKIEYETKKTIQAFLDAYDGTLRDLYNTDIIEKIKARVRNQVISEWKYYVYTEEP